MERNEEKALEQLRQLLKPFVETGGECAPPAWLRTASDEWVQLVRQCRLTPLFGRWVFTEADLPEWLARCRRDYGANVAASEKLLLAGSDLWRCFEAEGIMCLPMKGPFAGVSLYGDAALRQSMDVDLLVRPADSRRAFELACANGYALRAGGMPAGFYRRHHLHWSMHHEQKNTWLDLHWRLDHPFSLQRMNMDELFEHSSVVDDGGVLWREAEANRHFLMLCSHLWKECGPSSPNDTDWKSIRPALDLWTFLKKKCDQLDPEWLKKTARAWKMGPVVNHAVHVMETQWGESLSALRMEEFPMIGKCSASSIPGCSKELERLAVFRSERLQEVKSFFWPPREWFDGASGASLVLKRIAHAGMAGVHVSSSAIELAAEICWRKWSRRRGGARS